MKTIFTKVTFAAASLAAMSMAATRQPPQDLCCTVYSAPAFTGLIEEYCLQEDGRQDAFEIDIWGDVWSFGSIECGKNVDALICPGGFEQGPVAGQSVLEYKCVSDSLLYY